MSPKGDMTSIHHFFDYDDPHGNIVFNFTGRPIEDLTAFALGYQQAAHSLAGRLAQSRGYADYEGYPVLFLYRHSLELYLKAIVYRGAMLLGLVAERRPDTRDLFERHELVRLLPAIRAIFKEMDDPALIKVFKSMKESDTAIFLEAMAKQGDAQAKRVAFITEALTRTITEQKKAQ